MSLLGDWSSGVINKISSGFLNLNYAGKLRDSGLRPRNEPLKKLGGWFIVKSMVVCVCKGTRTCRNYLEKAS